MNTSLSRHSRAGGNPGPLRKYYSNPLWIPTCAGMTEAGVVMTMLLNQMIERITQW